MKKFLSILMVVAMILSLGISAMAEETNNGKITITNATNDQIYTIYKIFDAKPTEDGTGIAYTIDPVEEAELFKALFGDGEEPTNPYFLYYESSNYVEKMQTANDAEVIDYLTKLVLGDDTKEGVDVSVARTAVAGGPTVVFDGLPYGYYLITSSLGAVVTLDSSAPTATVIDKNQKPGHGFDKQVVTGAVNDVLNPDNAGKYIFSDSNTASIGDLVTYKVSFDATNYDGDEQVSYYQVNDAKGDGIWAEFDSFHVFVGGEELTKGYYLPVGNVINTGEWQYLGDGWEGIDEAQRSRDDADWYLVHLGLNEFRITIPWKTEHTIEGDETATVPGPYKIVYDETRSVSKFTSPAKVEVYYEAAITPSATIGVSDSTNLYNTAYASWGVAHDVLSTGTDRVVTTTYGLGIVKEDAADHKNLPGAVFKIYRDKDLTMPVYVIPTNIEGVYIVDSKGCPSEDITGIIMDDARELYGSKTAADIARLENYLNGAEQRNEVTSPVNGRIVILGLDKGEYYIEETDAPEGYNPMTKPQKMDIGDENLTNFIIFADSEGNVKEMVQPENGYIEYSYNIAYTVIQNSKGMELPSTGGEGTFWLVTIGTLMVIGFAIFLITHKKMAAYTD